MSYGCTTATTYSQMREGVVSEVDIVFDVAITVIEAKDLFLQDWVDYFNQSVCRHELGHVEIGVAWCKNVISLLPLPPDRLQEQSDALDVQNRAYDLATSTMQLRPIPTR